MIRIEELQKSYGAVKALDGVTLHIGEGELFAYLGPNGAGKTTTIRILNGLTRKGGGRVRLNGFDIDHESRQAKRQCGFVPQHLNLDSELTVRENMDIHGRLFDMSGAARRRRTDELLEYVELGDRWDSPVKQLSGGLKRRLMIARALMHEPRILFLDEPTVGLDAGIRRRIWALVKRVQQDGTTIFLTTHYIEEAEFLAGRVAFLDQGRVVAVDTPASFMERLGQWAVDHLEEEGIRTAYFHDNDEAKAYAESLPNEFSLRRVNLEDAFLAQTGKKVKP
ncbi:ABC transporter ATP-binding protein [Pelobacter propionicus]|uniref:ABC transporter related protein n=1 Tax=Pelobacter propionicus (strain DSM 2379 / NBRC 103807 / OttBd1) TaxID=338966 RepID=A1ANG4_PELPD|nr:ABC transporter ATP-binding protein [Pelobacter propionicus]ABK98884.1 ABC transporter related protein [Pelobacter propionicus DSM 2379]